MHVDRLPLIQKLMNRGNIDNFFSTDHTISLVVTCALPCMFSPPFSDSIYTIMSVKILHHKGHNYSSYLVLLRVHHNYLHASGGFMVGM